MVTPITPIEVQDSAPAPLNAMAIIATQRQQFHEKILRLRALREASEANIPKDKKPSKQ
jgi:phosphoribosylcarboxyaminoimidazole (NCAIR) mutase